jgi:glycosyltransferase involved in cell wall biosynthesis
MEFSIIIPTYKEEDYLERCLQSIIAQDYERSEFEVIVSDAHSPDGTAEIARKLADELVVSEQRGIALGRNAGARKSRGAVLVFVDADAQLAPSFLSRCPRVFSDRSVAGMTGVARPYDGGIPQRLIYYGTYGLVRLFNKAGLSLFPGVCAAYRKSVFDRAGGFREDFGVTEDLDLSRRISRYGRCIVDVKARAFVSTRRLKKYWASIMFFHIYSDMKYLITGRAPALYPKAEEMRSWRDIWVQSKKRA